MTALTKIIFSAAFLAAGFGLASMFGPPELADRVAEAIRPAQPAPSWGALQPLAAASLNDPSWAEYEAAAFRPAAPVGSTTSTLLAESTPAPQQVWRLRNDPAVTTAVAEAAPRGYDVSTTAWRESSAPIGWPTPPAASPSANDITPIGVAPPSLAPARAPSEGFPGNAFPGNVAPPWPGVSPAVDSGGLFTPPEANPGWPPSAPAPAAASGWDTGNELSAPTFSGNPEAATSSEWPGGAWPPQSSFDRPATPVTAEPARRSTTTPITPVTPIATLETQPPAPREPVRHVVGDGDTLLRLAARYLDDPQRAGEIFLANQQTLTHPDLLPIGTELVIPDRAAAPALSTTPGPAAPFARLMGPRPVGSP